MYQFKSGQFEHIKNSKNVYSNESNNDEDGINSFQSDRTFICIYVLFYNAI